MSEEVRRARHAVPRVMFWTIVLNGILAYAIILVILFCLGNLEEAVNAPFPILEICMQATGSTEAATAMVCGLLVISVAVTLGSIASASRLTWAWARDGGLPAWMSHINPKKRVPVRSVWLPIVMVMCLACLNMASIAAFGAFISLASLALFTSYLMAIGCLLYARLRSKVHFGDWHMGRFSVPVNIFALLYTGWMMIFFCFPTYLPVTGAGMNYALPIFAFVVLVALGLWFGWARNDWPGLNKEIVHAVLADSDRAEKD